MDTLGLTGETDQWNNVGFYNSILLYFRMVPSKNTRRIENGSSAIISLKTSPPALRPSACSAPHRHHLSSLISNSLGTKFGSSSSLVTKLILARLGLDRVVPMFHGTFRAKTTTEGHLRGGAPVVPHLCFQPQQLHIYQLNVAAFFQDEFFVCLKEQFHY